MFKELFVQYKRFEKYFFKADKTKDMIAYIKLKHQFRTMMAFSAFIFLFFLFMLILNGFILAMGVAIPLLFLITFRIQAYKTLYTVFFLAMMSVPPRYLPTPLAFLAPPALLFANIQLLIDTQSINVMPINLAFKPFGFMLMAWTVWPKVLEA